MSRIPCRNENPGCPYYESGCYEDIHHTYYPRCQYKSGVDKEFRELPQNKQYLCRQEHDELHATQLPPIKPSHTEMLAALGNHMVFFGLREEDE